MYVCMYVCMYVWHRNVELNGQTHTWCHYSTYMVCLSFTHGMTRGMTISFIIFIYQKFYFTCVFEKMKSVYLGCIDDMY